MIGRLLQPGLRLGRLSLPTHDLIDMFHRHADIVETFKKARAVRVGDFENNVRTAGSADAPADKIDSERSFAVDSDEHALETIPAFPILDLPDLS